MIYTFYSYKGGVGRSMALANVAAWFYEQGLRVVMIDWDLEAPGLETFFVSEGEVEKVRAKPGLIDMLMAYKDQYPLLSMSASRPPIAVAAASVGAVAESQTTNSSDSTSPANTFLGGSDRSADSSPESQLQELFKPPQRLNTAEAVEVLESNLPPLAYMLYQLRQKKLSADGTQRSLSLLSSGWRTKDRFADYGRAVQNFSWSEFYESYHGEAYFEWLRKQLNSDEFADVVLIDSRTGITEMGGVCTRQLADVVVSFTAPNIQNLSGVVQMAASFKRQDVIDARDGLELGAAKRPLEVVVVPTRVENSELSERAKFKEVFTEQLSEVPAAFRILGKTFWDLAIPYVPKYSYGERLAIGDPISEDLQIAYKTLAAHLVLLTPEGSVIRTRFTEELRRVFKLLPRILVSDVGNAENPEWSAIRQKFLEAGLSVWSSPTDNAQAGDAALQATGNIDLAEFLVLPVTREGVCSEAFLKQWRYARQQGVCVQLVKGRSEEVLTREELPAWLGNLHIFDPARELEALIDILKNPCISSRVPFMVPELPESYVKRPAEVEGIVSALSATETGANVQANVNFNDDGEKQAPPNIAATNVVGLCGPPGSGKMVLAQAACNDERLLAEFRDGILWATLGDDTSVPAQLALLYGALTGDSKTHVPSDLGRLVAAKLTGKKFLLVVTRVREESQLRPFLEILSTGSLFFTTRDRGLTAGIGARVLEIEQMSSTEAVDLLVKQSGIASGHESELNEIVELMGNTPLSVKLAGAALKQRLSDGGKAEGALRDVYQQTASCGVVAFDQKNASERNLSVATSVAASLAWLTEPEKAAFLKLSVLEAATEVSLNELGVLWGQNESEVKDLAQRLATLSLLSFKPEQGTVHVSRFIHSFLVAQKSDSTILNATIEKAEAVFGSLTPDEQSIARRVLTRLVHVSRPENKLPDMRQRYELEKFDLQSRAVIDSLQKVGLLMVEGTTENKGTVQLADDSVVQGWNRLRGWLDEDRDFLLWRQSLEANIAEWESSKRHNTSALLAGKEISTAQSWLSKRKDDVNQAESLFVSESANLESRKHKQTIQRAGVFVVAAIALAGLIYWQYLARVKQDKALSDLSAVQILDSSSQSLEPSQVNYREVISAYDEFIKNNPDFAEGYVGRGNAYRSLGQVDDAIKDYDQAIALKQNYPETWKEKAVALKLKADKGEPAYYDRAIEAFTTAIQFRPDYADAYFGRGQAYQAKADQGDRNSLELAIADYTRIIAQLKRDSPPADVYFQRGLAYRAKGDNFNALTDLQKALELPGSDVIRENIKNSLVTLEASGDPTQTAAAPRIFIQYNDPSDESEIEQVAADLRGAGFKVIGKPQVSAAKAFGDGDVRTFSPSDKTNGEIIAKLVEQSLQKQNRNKKIIARPLKDFPNVPLGNIEVWIASLSLPPPPISTEQESRSVLR